MLKATPQAVIGNQNIRKDNQNIRKDNNLYATILYISYTYTSLISPMAVALVCF